jgi:hypothetical protein
LIPDKDAKPLGMDVAEMPTPAAVEEEDDGDIFEERAMTTTRLVGLKMTMMTTHQSKARIRRMLMTNHRYPKMVYYDSRHAPPNPSSPRPENDTTSMPPPPPPHTAPISSRNYFGGLATADQGHNAATPANPLPDPTILAALKKASSIAPSHRRKAENQTTKKQPVLLSSEEAPRLSRSRRRGYGLGFGSSRFGDEEDMEERKEARFGLVVGGR